MSRADAIFKYMCTDILNNGTDTKNQEVRPVWTDTNEKAYTIKKFGVINKYDLREEFPAITFRKTNIKLATDELLWIYQKKSTNVHDLKSHIWDAWADKDGYIGKSYGYQVQKCQSIHENSITATEERFPSVYREYTNDWHDKLETYMDQMDSVLYKLRTTPYTRDMIINLWSPTDLKYMALKPCVFNLIFNVTDEGVDKPILNMMVTQRSQDVLVANNWNVCQYAVLLMMVAQVSNMIPGKLIHSIGDAHIYDRHVDLVKELIGRQQHPAPIVKLDPDIDNFYDFTMESVSVECYRAGKQIKNIPVAV